MNIASARNVSEFVHVLARDNEGRPIWTCSVSPDLSKRELLRLAVLVADGKQQWYSGESVRLAPDAFLKNDDGFVRLYRSDKSGKFPKVTRLATVFWLDPGNIEAGWQRYTEAQRAREELFSP